MKILPQKYPNIGVAAFIDFYDIKSATEAKDANHKLQGHELRTNFKANPGEKHDSGRSREDRSRDRDKHDERERYWGLCDGPVVLARVVAGSLQVRSCFISIILPCVVAVSLC